jgi:hypothetical protein
MAPRCGVPALASPRNAQQQKRTLTSPLAGDRPGALSVSVSLVRRGQNRRERVWAVRHQDNRVCVAFYAERSIGSRFLRMADTVIKAEIAKHNSRGVL